MKHVWKETVNKLLQLYERREAENISYLLMEDVFHVSKSDILLGSEKEIDGEKLKMYIKRLLENEPLQYVTGFTYFYGRKFLIQKGALIPRPETEELVQLIISDNEKLDTPRILDVGVGSGCIAISLNKELNGVAFGTDISEEALEIAKKNASELKADVSFFSHDIFSSDLPIGELDILVSNPPYIPNGEEGLMNKNVLEFEPKIALFVPDDDPIRFYKRIANQGLVSLRKEGKLYFEIHENYGSDVKNYLKKIGYTKVKIHQDMQEKNRMVSCSKA